MRKNKDKRNVVIVDQLEDEFTLMCGMGLLFRNILSFQIQLFDAIEILFLLHIP